VSAHRFSGVRTLGTVGQPLPGVEAAVLDDADRALATDEIGEVLCAHPAGAEAAVVGMPFCQARLAKYECPRQARFLDVLPQSPIGKILRKELRSLP
jgi:acyl-coenzyme A synthetase/AMP-(fatty) acid ligase